MKKSLSTHKIQGILQPNMLLEDQHNGTSLPLQTGSRMRSECDVSLTSQPSFRSDKLFASELSKVELHAANSSLQICDVNIRIAFAFAESMKRASCESC